MDATIFEARDEFNQIRSGIESPAWRLCQGQT